jgi:hypothetical protein
MGRPEKGSKEALEWAAKMKKAREAKKGIKGGMITDAPFGLSNSGTKLSLKRGNDKTPSPPKKTAKMESPEAEYPDIDFRPIKTEPIVSRAKVTKPIAKKQTNPIVLGKGASASVPTPDTPPRDVIRELLYEMGNSLENINIPQDLRNSYQTWKERLMEELNMGNLTQGNYNYLKSRLVAMVEEKNTLIKKISQARARGRTIKGNIVGDETDIIEDDNIDPYDIRVAAPVENPTSIAQPIIIEPIYNNDRDDIEFLIPSRVLHEGRGICKGCSCCEMCGGALSLRTFQRGLTKATSQLSKGLDKINPMSYAIKNKKTSKAMRQSGNVTQNYLLPAVTTAGMPLYYGSAGTAGMMLGGPLGAMAATKAADTLYQEMVGKRGYDPRLRQKSKTLGVVSNKVGELGASNLKQGASGKGMRMKKKLVIYEE